MRASLYQLPSFKCATLKKSPSPGTRCYSRAIRSRRKRRIGLAFVSAASVPLVPVSASTHCFIISAVHTMENQENTRQANISVILLSVPSRLQSVIMLTSICSLCAGSWPPFVASSDPKLINGPWTQTSNGADMANTYSSTPQLHY
jgi:hypothetical protein